MIDGRVKHILRGVFNPALHMLLKGAVTQTFNISMYRYKYTAAQYNVEV